MRHIGKLVGADPELLRQNLAVPLCLGEQNKEVRVLEDIFNLRAGKEVLYVLRQSEGTQPFLRSIFQMDTQ